MSEDRRGPHPAVVPRVDTGAIRGSALGLLVAGAVCLYFSFQWLVDAPNSATEAETAIWFGIDHAFRWGLRIGGGAFLLVGVVAALGRRIAMLLAAIVESAFALLMATMAVETFLEARVDGHFDPTTILLLALTAIGISGARYSLRQYSGKNGPAPAD
jgi:hypothetical protein